MMSALRIAAVALAAWLAGTAAQAAAPGYRVLDRISGPDGGWDYVRVDPANNRVLVARGGSVMSVDLATNAVTAGLAPGSVLHDAMPVNGGKEFLVTTAARARRSSPTPRPGRRSPPCRRARAPTRRPSMPIRAWSW